MTYELAKKLKDAGFEQTHRFLEIEGAINPMCVCGALNSDDVHIPTLSELIDVCGEFSLIKNRDALCEGEQVEEFTYEACTEDFSFISDTPEEAVANLWLKLNEK